MSTLTERLDAAGVRLTAQRRIIAECLDGEHRHVTADELLADAQKCLPEVGRATVYKALACFIEAGAVAIVQIDDGPKFFDPNPHIEHDHLLCRSCRRMWDLPRRDQDPAHRVTADATDVVDTAITIDTVGTVGSGDEAGAGPFEVERVEITYHGLCGWCHDASPQP